MEAEQEVDSGMKVEKMEAETSKESREQSRNEEIPEIQANKEDQVSVQNDENQSQAEGNALDDKDEEENSQEVEENPEKSIKLEMNLDEAEVEDVLNANDFDEELMKQDAEKDKTGDTSDSAEPDNDFSMQLRPKKMKKKKIKRIFIVKRKPDDDQEKRQTSEGVGNQRCCVPNCPTNNCTSGRALFRFAKRNSEQAEKWTKAVNRPPYPDGSPWQPTSWTHICSDHFYTGRPNPTNIHPDYVPSIFPWNENRRPKTVEEKKKFKEKLDEINKKINDIVSTRLGVQLNSPGNKPNLKRKIVKVQKEKAEEEINDDYYNEGLNDADFDDLKDQDFAVPSKSNYKKMKRAKIIQSQWDKRTTLNHIKSVMEKAKKLSEEELLQNNMRVTRLPDRVNGLVDKMYSWSGMSVKEKFCDLAMRFEHIMAELRTNHKLMKSLDTQHKTELRMRKMIQNNARFLEKRNLELTNK